MHLETSEFHFKDAFVEIENHLTTELVNTGLLPCYYSWSSQVHMHMQCSQFHVLSLVLSQ